MLLSDAADADIVRLDADADLAHIRLERLELAELELTDRLERARDKSERERLASEHERAAAQIETATKALEAPIALLAAAFASLVEAIPTETGVAKDYENHLTPCPAESIDVAQAIAAAALHSAIPGLFERLTLVRRGNGQPLASPAPVARIYDLGSLRIGGRVSGDPAPLPAPVAAQQLIVQPLLEKARTLRAGDAAHLEAAE